MAEAPTTLAQAPNSTKAGLAQAKLRATLHHATRTLALQRAMWATKAQLQRQGLRVAQFTHRDLVIQAEAYRAEHRADLIPEAAAMVEQWRRNGFFERREDKLGAGGLEASAPMRVAGAGATEITNNTEQID
jgi:hypothetical protein